MISLWLFMLMQVFTPSADRLASYEAGAFEAHLHAGVESAQPFGAIGHMARYTPLVARAI
jgi:hypothetical protein